MHCCHRRHWSHLHCWILLHVWNWLHIMYFRYWPHCRSPLRRMCPRNKYLRELRHLWSWSHNPWRCYLRYCTSGWLLQPWNYRCLPMLSMLTRIYPNSSWGYKYSMHTSHWHCYYHKLPGLRSIRKRLHHLQPRIRYLWPYLRCMHNYCHWRLMRLMRHWILRCHNNNLRCMHITMRHLQHICNSLH